MVTSGEPGKIEKRMVVEYGITLDGVWLPLAMLRRLGAHGPWDAPFTEATADQERVLLRHVLAERHNQVGLYHGVGLTGFLDAIPYEPTVSFAKIPVEGTDHDNRGQTWPRLSWRGVSAEPPRTLTGPRRATLREQPLREQPLREQPLCGRHCLLGGPSVKLAFLRHSRPPCFQYGRSVLCSYVWRSK
jgi:hypothetical protein